MSIDWDRYKGTFVKWETPGQMVEGVVTHIEVGNFKGTEYPELTIRTNNGDQKVSANQSQLQRALADDPPNIGDGIRIEYLGEATTAAPGFNPAKRFRVAVNHGTAPVPPADLVPPAPPPPAPAPAASAPAPQPAATDLV